MGELRSYLHIDYTATGSWVCCSWCIGTNFFLFMKSTADIWDSYPLCLHPYTHTPPKQQWSGSILVLLLSLIAPCDTWRWFHSCYHQEREVAIPSPFPSQQSLLLVILLFTLHWFWHVLDPFISHFGLLAWKKKSRKVGTFLCDSEVNQLTDTR